MRENTSTEMKLLQEQLGNNVLVLNCLYIVDRKSRQGQRYAYAAP